jgi:glycosyltransferase involved in cell wall biosynthesis
MKVLTVVAGLGIGGTERAAHNFTLGYFRAGHEARVLCLGPGGPRAESLRAAGVPILFGNRSLASSLASIESWRPDVVHVHRPGFHDAMTGIVRAFKAAFPCKVVETNVFARVDYREGGLIDLHFQLSKWCLWKWSRWSARLRPRPLGVVIPYCIEPPAFHPEPEAAVRALKARLGVPPDAFVFGRVGQPAAGKWSPLMVAAFERIAGQDLAAHLLLVGCPPELLRPIDALPPDVRRRVVLIPAAAEDERLRLYYGAMDVFVHAAAIGESFGFVLAEALLCGKPVITLSTPLKDNTQLELIGETGGGLIATDVRTFAECMSRLRNDPGLRGRLAERGRSEVLRRFSTDAVVGDLLSCLALLDRARSRQELSGLLEEAGFVTRVPDESIEALLRYQASPASGWTRLMMAVVHEPWLYRLYRRLRGQPA